MRRITGLLWLATAAPLVSLLGCAVGDTEVTLADRTPVTPAAVAEPEFFSDDPRDFVLKSEDRLKPRVTPYPVSRTHGNVRVTLVSVGHETFFVRGDEVRGAQAGEVYAVPGFRLNYLVEALGDEPIRQWGAGSRRVVANGREVEYAYRNVVPGGVDGAVRLSMYRRVLTKEMLPAVERGPGAPHLDLDARHHR
jgi:hypothetical protein